MDSQIPWNPIRLLTQHKIAGSIGVLAAAFALTVFSPFILEWPAIGGAIVVAGLAWGLVLTRLIAGRRWLLGVATLMVPVAVALPLVFFPLFSTAGGVYVPASNNTGIPLPAPTVSHVTVFYATDRRQSPVAAVQYESTRNEAETLALGHIVVGVPKDHRLGDVERPGIWTLYREDPDKHFVMLESRQLTYEDFYDGVRTRVMESAVKQAFVFIHGFNVAFMDAVYRTAQMAYDLNFDGAPILYSWPSAASLTPIGYTTDSNNSDWTVDHLQWFLEDVAAKSGAQRVHLIAHSMGNKALVNTLNRMPRSSVRKFSHIMLTAPDMDAATFIQLSGALKGHAQMTTLYASANDVALLASKKLQTYRRAGDTSGGVVVVPGIDTVDVSAVDTNFIGHFYYGENRSVLSDMFLVLTQNLPAAERPSLRRSGKPPNQYWRFAP